MNHDHTGVLTGRQQLSSSSQLDHETVSSPRSVQVETGAAAIGASSIAAAPQSVVVRGSVHAPINTGPIFMLGGPPVDVNEALRVWFTQALEAITRPAVTDLFDVVRDPVEVPA